MANPSTAHEPSMEEILASIRQIISEDDDSRAPARPQPRRAAGAELPAEAGEERLSQPDAEAEPDSRGASEQPTPGQPTPDQPALASPLASHSAESQSKAMKPQASEMRSQSAEAPAKASSPARSVPGERPYSAQASEATLHSDAARPSLSQEGRPLLSQNSDDAVSSAFGALAHTIFSQNARTLDDLVADMLRPMLKEWLDDNLPALVERLVKEEIERVSRGRR